jgi:hypothetical protein
MKNSGNNKYSLLHGTERFEPQPLKFNFECADHKQLIKTESSCDFWHTECAFLSVDPFYSWLRLLQSLKRIYEQKTKYWAR